MRCIKQIHTNVKCRILGAVISFARIQHFKNYLVHLNKQKPKTGGPSEGWKGPRTVRQCLEVELSLYRM